MQIKQRASTIARVLLDQAWAVVMTEVERRARKILSAKNATRSFTMGMGTAFFSGVGGKELQETGYMNTVLSLIDEFDSELKLTGTPLRLEVNHRGVIKNTTDSL